MFNDDEIELTTEERASLSGLSRELAPSDLLEERVVRALRQNGHFGGAPAIARRSLPAGWRIAAALALFIGGVATGRYLMIPGVPQSASVTAPSTLRDRDTTTPSRQSIPAKGETVVAEREMWM